MDRTVENGRMILPTLTLTYTIGAVFCAWLLWVFSVECRTRPFSAVAFVALGPVILAAVVVCSIGTACYRGLERLWKRN